MPDFPGIAVTGSPITSALGQGTISGNAIQIAGLTLQPSAPGYSLTSATAGPGFAFGSWSLPAIPERRSGTVSGDIAAGPVAGSGGGGGSDPGLFDYQVFADTTTGPGGGMSVASWAILALILAGLLKGGK